MREILWGFVLLGILIGAAAAGIRMQRVMKEHHRSAVTTDAVRTVAGMVVTFAALVLGLLVTTTKADFDQHAAIYRHYGISLIELDLRLREYGGPEAAAIQRALRAFTITVLAVTWPNEPHPPLEGSVSVATTTPTSDETIILTRELAQIDDSIERLSPNDPYHRRLWPLLQDDIRRIAGDRWTLVEHAHSKLDPIFLCVMMLWLVVVFVIFGATSPANALTYFVIGLSALAVASSLYLVIDFNDSLGGFLQVPSQPIRDALWHIDAPQIW